MKYWIWLCALCSFSLDAADFYQLMGKGTKHWQFVSQQTDVAFLNFAEEVYEEHKEAQYTVDAAYKIPPVIHFIWLGPKHFPPESIENVRSWIAHNPEWTVKLWTDRDRMAPCNGMQVIDVTHFPFKMLRRQFYESENWGEKSDILRYEILFQEGGVYVDHDANCLQSFEGMHKGYDFYCGLETPHEPFVGRNITCGNGVIGARAGHPTLKKVLERIAEKWDALKMEFRGRDPHSKIEIVMQRTYIALTHCLENSFNQEGNRDIVLPAGYFFAKSGIAPILSQHFYATSWDDFRKRDSNEERFFKKAMHTVLHEGKTLQKVLGILIAWNLLLLLSLLRIRRNHA